MQFLCPKCKYKIRLSKTKLKKKSNHKCPKCGTKDLKELKVDKTIQLTMVPESKLKKKNLGHIGAHGRTADTEFAGERLKKDFGNLIAKSKILDWELIAGLEGHKVTRNGKGWDDKENRHEGGLVGKAGLEIRVFNKLKPHIGGKLYVWPRPYDNDLPYPVYNIPSDVCDKEEVEKRGYRELQEFFASKTLWYLVLRRDRDGKLKEYTFGRYQDIPLKHYYTWNKGGPKDNKHNSVHFGSYDFYWEGMRNEGLNAVAELEMVFG